MNKERFIGIIGAMEVEIAQLRAQMENPEVRTVAGIDFYSGTVFGTPCVLAKCGPGKVNAAVCAQSMVLKYPIGLLLNIGVAGGLGAGIHIGDLVVATACVQHDYDTSAAGDEPGFVSGICKKEIPCDGVAGKLLCEAALQAGLDGKVHTGTVATGDCFVADYEQQRQIGHRFQAKAVEMEGGSIAHVCWMNGVPCGVLRAISDHADDNSKVDYPLFVQRAAEKTQALLREGLQGLAAVFCPAGGGAAEA